MTGRRRVWTAPALVAVVGLGFGLYWFQPWKLWVDDRVDEALPTLASPSVQLVDEPGPTGSPTAPSPSTTPPAGPSATPSKTAAAQAVLLSRGKLISHEHETSGTASVVRLPDGRRVLTLADLDTSNGPDVEVWLTDAPVVSGEKGWYLADDGAHRSLGDLKGNQGNQVYEIPAGVELSEYTSVSLWCARFDVSFGAAELAPA